MTSISPLLAAVMIVKNEEQNLARCLQSIRELCDEIIVVDTGSTDSTVSIAESFGARIFHRKWKEDFAAARNECLEHTDAQWVLYIDADEILVDVDAVWLRELLAKATDIAAFGIQVSPKLGWLPYTDFRLWRHDPAIRFVGDIHETTLPDIQRLAAERNQVLKPISLRIQHFGYEGDQTTKNLRNLPLLERQRKVTPKKINILSQLARIHYQLGNDEIAESIWREAIEIIRQEGIKEITDVTIFPAYAEFLMSKGFDAEDLLAEARQIQPNYQVLHFVSAKNHLIMHRYHEALTEAELLIAYGENGETDLRFAYNKNMFTMWPYSISAEALFALKRFAEARFAFGNMVSLGVPYEIVRERIRQCEQFDVESEPSSQQTFNEKIDLSNATFLIPLRIDSGDRLRNVIDVSRWLTKTFQTTVLVGHAEPEKIRPLLDESVQIVEITDNPRHPFHLTKAFNELARRVTTPVLVRYDVDVVFPPSQLVEAAHRAQHDPKTLVLPYSYWHAITREEIDEFLNTPITSKIRLGYPRSLGDPVGGCVVQSTEGFFMHGMDNEHFIGWSSEDKERIERLTKLGCSISRVEGPLFHLEHDQVPMRPENKQFYYQGEAERRRQQLLTADDLRREISQWPWRRTSDRSQQVTSDDLTIIIPLRVDSTNRLHNAISCTNSLLKSTTSRIIVGTHLPEKIADYFDPRVELICIEDEQSQLFHRTRLVNDLAMHVDTEYFANLDCDIFVPPQQWLHVLNELRMNSADVVYPFDGKMIDIPSSYFPWLENNDFDSLPFALRSLAHANSVGGCVVWRRQSFLECGMENEHFVSWGFEDDERFVRAQILGLNIRRVPGNVFHLRHPRGENSSDSHPHFLANKQELERISTMTSEQLRHEIEQWPWRQEALSH